jgi:hypothetical protein
LAGFKRVANPIRNRSGATQPKVAYLKPRLILVGPRKIEGLLLTAKTIYSKPCKKPLMIIIKIPKCHEKLKVSTSVLPSPYGEDRTEVDTFPRRGTTTPVT